jgi:hypothetical protein
LAQKQTIITGSLPTLEIDGNVVLMGGNLNFTLFLEPTRHKINQ